MDITTDNQQELFDIVDKNDRVVGQARRWQVHHNKNLIHRSVGICVFNPQGELFMQKRSASKDTDPLTWTISCSGHVLSGDGYEATAHRELQEELGVDTQIKQVGKLLCQAPAETEISMIYTAFHEGPFTLHPGEIEEGTFFTRKELFEYLMNGKVKLSFMGKLALEKIGWL